ncbi:MAG: hypothetical protein FWD19_00745 [Defluviitaleaceae bacterium]|nr:hypothetical protein [Defluviitaleaceae bacterium]
MKKIFILFLFFSFVACAEKNFETPAFFPDDEIKKIFAESTQQNRTAEILEATRKLEDAMKNFEASMRQNGTTETQIADEKIETMCDGCDWCGYLDACECELCEFARRREGVSPANVKIRPTEKERATCNDINEFVDLDQIENYHEFDEWDDSARTRSIFTTDVAVQDFQFFSIHYHWGIDCCGDDSCFCMSVDEIIFSLDELTPEKPLVLGWRYEGCFTSSKGVSFSFEGEQKFFEIIHSNYNGHLFLKEFEPKKN